MMDVYYDPKQGLFRCGDPDKLTPQQRANWMLLQAVLEAEFDRGFRRGLVQGQADTSDIYEKKLRALHKLLDKKGKSE